MRFGKLNASMAAGALALISQAQAAQQLIPSPYPEMLGGTADLGGGARPRSRHQHLLPQPVPQNLGANALGNPESPRARNHQHLLRTPYWRQYHHFK